MSAQTIANPSSAFTTVTDHRTMKDAAGGALPLAGHTEELYAASGAIAVGLAVALAAPTSATVPARIGVATDTTAIRNLGIAAKAAAAAGDVIPVVTRGLAFAVLGGTVAINTPVSVDSAGKLVSVTPGAGIVSATILGFTLKGGDANDVVPIFVTGPV